MSTSKKFIRLFIKENYLAMRCVLIHYVFIHNCNLFKQSRAKLQKNIVTILYKSIALKMQYKNQIVN